jgi:hypothetical protein
MYYRRQAMWKKEGEKGRVGEEETARPEDLETLQEFRK